jgi:hypothetical protein
MTFDEAFVWLQEQLRLTRSGITARPVMSAGSVCSQQQTTNQGKDSK